MEERSQSVGVVSDLERAAMRGEPMPQGLPYTDQLYFLGLSRIYDRYRAGYITREQGAADKKQLEGERNKINSRWALEDKLRRASAPFFIGVERALSTYQRGRSLENADALARAVNGLLPQEVTEL